MVRQELVIFVVVKVVKGSGKYYTLFLMIVMLNPDNDGDDYAGEFLCLTLWNLHQKPRTRQCDYTYCA